MYFDIDFHCINDLQILLNHTTPNKSKLLFLSEEWPFSFKNGSLHNGVLISNSPNHPFWLDVLSEIQKRLTNLLPQLDFQKDIQKSVFQLTGTALLSDVAYSYITHNKSLLHHNIVILPYGFFCPLLAHPYTHHTPTYIDTYDLPYHTPTPPLSLPSKQIINHHARNFTLAFLAPSLKVWQQTFTTTQPDTQP